MSDTSREVDAGRSDAVALLWANRNDRDAMGTMLGRMNHTELCAVVVALANRVQQLEDPADLPDTP